MRLSFIVLLLAACASAPTAAPPLEITLAEGDERCEGTVVHSHVQQSMQRKIPTSYVERTVVTARGPCARATEPTKIVPASLVPEAFELERPARLIVVTADRGVGLRGRIDTPIWKAGDEVVAIYVAKNKAFVLHPPDTITSARPGRSASESVPGPSRPDDL